MLIIILVSSLGIIIFGLFGLERINYQVWPIVSLLFCLFLVVLSSLLLPPHPFFDFLQRYMKQFSKHMTTKDCGASSKTESKRIPPHNFQDRILFIFSFPSPSSSPLSSPSLFFLINKKKQKLEVNWWGLWHNPLSIELVYSQILSFCWSH